MAENGSSEMGKQIRDIVQDAIRTQDFTRINEQLQGTISLALQEVKRQTGNRNASPGTDEKVKQAANAAGQVVSSVAKQVGKEILSSEISSSLRHSSSYNSAKHYARGQAPVSYNGQRTVTRRQTAGQPPLYPATLISRSPKGRISNVLCTVFGSLGMTVAGCVAAATFITLAASGLSAIPVLATITGCIATVNGLLLMKGASSRKRIDRFYRYCSLFQGKTYCQISDMAKAIGRSQKYVINDLRKMIEDKMFPQGHFDTEYTLFILSDDTFHRYLQTKQQHDEHMRMLASETEQDRIYRETAELGERYLQKIAFANEQIPGEEISEKLYRLEAIIRKIFEHVKAHPEQLPELRRFMDYYLPTTLKLVETYCELQKQPTAGPNIQKAMGDIESSLDTIILAFERLFDSLFADTALDVSTDISVLNTMLAREGLAGDDFGRK